MQMQVQSFSESNIKKEETFQLGDFHSDVVVGAR